MRPRTDGLRRESLRTVHCRILADQAHDVTLSVTLPHHPILGDEGVMMSTSRARVRSDRQRRPRMGAMPAARKDKAAHGAGRDQPVLLLDLAFAREGVLGASK